MSRRRRFRERLPFAPKQETDFRWRSRDVSRLEGLSDVVFGFALTLLVASSEAPRTFGEMVNILRDFPTFVACFALLMYLWNEHYRFFRRYGLEDITTRMINYGILLLVVFSIYPLKFLFSGWFRFMFGPNYGPTNVTPLSLDELYALYIVYGIGMGGIYLLYMALFRHAWRKRDALQLSAIERIQTRASITEFGVQFAVCMLSVLLAWRRAHPILPGVIFGSLGPMLGFTGWWYGRQIEILRAQQAAANDQQLAA